jgi:hypothetical protein
MMRDIHTSATANDLPLLNDDGVRPVAKMNCDRVARAYQTLEYFSFGGALQSCRVMFLGEVADCRRALLCGDGDGRFLAELLRTNREVCADFVDLSAGMINAAKRRVDAMGSQAGAQTNFHAGDVRCFEPVGTAAYDLITAHFFLDCFDDREVAGVARKLVRSRDPALSCCCRTFAFHGKGLRATSMPRLFADCTERFD